MALTPPRSLINLIHDRLYKLLSENPAASSSEAYLQNHLEFEIINENINPRYYLRIGINYHGNNVQHIGVDSKTNRLIGWNEHGDALGTGKKAKMLLSGVTIFGRDPNEQLMSDTKVGGGEIPRGKYVRIEFKARGWLGKTKNLDGKQLIKDLDLLKNDRADLLVICLSETAHKKWRGEGPIHQARRRTGTTRFLNIFVGVDSLTGTDCLERNISFEGQDWTISSRRITGNPTSIMPGAEHIITMCWRRNITTVSATESADTEPQLLQPQFPNDQDD